MFKLQNIALLSHASKTLLRIILERIRIKPKQKLQTNWRDSDKEGGQEIKSRMSEYWMHKAREQQQPLYMCFVDVKKTFDSIFHDKLWVIMMDMEYRLISNFRFFKMAAAAILKNRKFATSRPQYERCRWNLTKWSISTLLTVPTVKNLKFLKSTMAAAAILKNRIITLFWPRFKRFRQNLAWWPFWPLKIWNFKRPIWRRRHLEISKNRYIAGIRTHNR